MSEATVNKPNNNGDDLVMFIKLGAGVAIVIVIAIAIAYAAFLALIAGAIWLGVKTGCALTSGSFSPPPYEQVKRFGEKQKIHLKHLEGESDEVKQLAEQSFEDLKIQVYRPKEEQRPGAIRLLEFIRTARQFFKE